MKTFIQLSLLLFPLFSSAQITTAITKANFGIDADLKANYINAAENGAGDDWYINSAGSGVGVIDTTGAAAIVARYATDVSSRSQTFSKIMKQSPFTTVNNRLLIDAVFHRDFHGTDSTIFASGSNKNGMSPANWSCPVAQSIPDKNDLLDVFTHVRRAGPNTTDSLWMFGGVSIENTTGNRYFDFELYQTDFYYDRPTRTFKNYGRNAGHTAWTFDASGNILTAGDIIFSAEYSSSSLTLIEARIWINKNDLAITPTQFRWGTEFDGDGTGAVYGYASISPKSSGAFYTGLQCSNNVWAGPFSLVLGDNSVTSNYVARQYMEFSVNLSKLGLDPAAYSANACGSPFRRVMVKTRSSTSFSAELKDFVAPFRLFDYPTVDAFADIVYFCGSMPTVPLNVLNPNTSSVYTWTTSDGHIQGTNTGPTINVTSAGTYYVSHQLHSSCPVYSTDSIKILYTPTCLILDMQIASFNASKSSQGINIQWQLKNNQHAKTIQVEYSSDGIHFNTIRNMVANSHTGDESYSFCHTGYIPYARVLYYRIRVYDANGQSKISSVATVTNFSKDEVNVFPVPSKGPVFISTSTPQYEYVLSDANGKIVSSDKNCNAAKNKMIKETAVLSPGVYYLKLITASGTSTQKLIIEK